jgi:hypothetical protein
MIPFLQMNPIKKIRLNKGYMSLHKEINYTKKKYYKHKAKIEQIFVQIIMKIYIVSQLKYRLLYNLNKKIFRTINKLFLLR